MCLCLSPAACSVAWRLAPGTGESQAALCGVVGVDVGVGVGVYVCVGVWVRVRGCAGGRVRARWPIAYVRPRVFACVCVPIPVCLSA